MKTDDPEPSTDDDELVKSLIESRYPAHLVVHYVLVAEVVDPDFEGRALVTRVSKNLPFWHARGMLEHAEIPEGYSDEDEDED